MKNWYCFLIAAFLLSSTFCALAQKESSSNRKLFKQRKHQSKKAKDTVVYSGRSRSMSITLGAKKKPYIIIDWIEPGDGPITLYKGFLTVKVKVFSPVLIHSEDVVVYHNEKLLGSKMDVSGLFGQQNEFNYSNRIPLVEGTNKIVVKVSKDSLQKSSEPLIVNKKGNVASITQLGSYSTSSKATTSIYWWTEYDPVVLNDKPYTAKEKVLPVKFKILTTENIDISKVHILHNEQEIKPSLQATLNKDYQGNFSFTDNINLAEMDGLNEVYLEVITKSGVVRSEKLKVNYSPLRPNLYILSIGTETNLQYTLKDARDFGSLFRDQGGASGNRIFNKVVVDTLIGSMASAQEIKGTIEEIKVRYYTGNIDRDDVILTFISSHGFLLNGDFRVQGDDYAPSRQRSTSVSFKNEIIDVLKDIPCKKIIIIDACHSGGARANAADINFEINKLNSIEKGLTVLASSRGEEQSYEDTAWQNGAFTEAIIRGLKEGKADANGNRIITLHELYKYVSKEVESIVKKVKNRAQNPTLVNDELGDVAIYVRD